MACRYTHCRFLYGYYEADTAKKKIMAADRSHPIHFKSWGALALDMPYDPSVVLWLAAIPIVSKSPGTSDIFVRFKIKNMIEPWGCGRSNGNSKSC